MDILCVLNEIGQWAAIAAAAFVSIRTARNEVASARRHRVGQENLGILIRTQGILLKEHLNREHGE